MSQSIIAYRYAKALIDLANEQGVVNEVNTDMAFFEEVCEQNDKFTAVMASPIVRHEKKFGILRKIFENRVNKVTYSIFNVLTTKNRENLILPIAQEFQKIFNDQNGIQKVQVSSAEKLNEKQLSDLNKIVESAVKKKVILEERIDESLIGGYVLRVGDTQIDTSVKKKLNDLKLALA